jgi:segregation and condensation protein A
VATIAHRLELDLDAFTGPFDLLLSLILREELDLLEVELAEIVIAYVDHLEAEGELDLEAATEFLVLIAALLELKSRLMLPGEESLDELGDLAPAEAAEELLERMLQYARFRGAGAWTAAAHAAGQAYLHRSAPLPAALRRVSVEIAERAYDPNVLGQAIGSLLRTPPPLDLRHMAMPRVSVADRLAHLRDLLRRRSGRFSFDEAVEGADRVTEAVTLFALLELYKGGEAAWEQDEPFGPITIQGAA